MWDWEDYLHIAKEFADTADGSIYPEAYKRACISRAYYSLFNIARNYIDPYHNLSSDGIHKYVGDHFTRNSDAKLQAIGSKLTTLRKQRNECDYDNAMTDLDKKAFHSKRFAESGIDAINAIGT